MPSSSSQNSDGPPGLLHTLAAVFSGVLFGLFLSKLRALIQDSSETVHVENPTPHETPQSEHMPQSPEGESYLPFHQPIAHQAEIHPIEDGRKTTMRDRHLVRMVDLRCYCRLCSYRVYQWRAQINALKIDERAWVVVSLRGSIQWQEGLPVSVGYRISNVGKTPAREIKGKFAISVFQQGEHARFNFTEKEPKSGFFSGLIAPKDGSDSTTFLFDPTSYFVQPLTPQLREQVASGKSFVIVRGTVEYTDIFRVRHWTHFCSYPFDYPQGLNREESLFFVAEKHRLP